MKKSFLFISYLFLFCLSEAFSVPANPRLQFITLDDGRQVQVKKLGDENFHYYMSSDGLCYVKGRGGNFQEINFDEVSRIQRLISPRNVSESSFYKSFPTEGNCKSLVILVQFSNLSFAVDDPKNAFSRMLNEEGYSENGATGSARDYFYENSQGKFSLDFEVVGPVTLDKPMEYYGENDSSLPYQNKDIRAQEVVVDACKAADDIIDFAQYDYNGDGRVDNVFVVYSGYSEADGGSADCIWPHEWNLVDAGFDLTLDGKQIYSYSCCNELKDGVGADMVGIGTFCHEFGHVLGLPDLYTTNSSNAFTPGAWSVMDVGSYNNDGRTPPYMSSYERYVLGWISPEELPVGADCELPSLESNKAYILNTENPDEYFLFENRQLKGWDAFVPGHGMLVWHIDYDKEVWDMSAINNDYLHQHVDILEADNSLTSHTRAGDTFPGKNGITELNDNTLPGLITWDNKPMFVDIFNIEEKEEKIYFSTKKSLSDIEAPVVKDADNLNPTSFVARWNKSVGANDYEIYVEEVASGEVLSGYNWKRVGDVDSVYVVMLSPLTEYSYKLRARNGVYVSPESSSVTVTTPDYTFEFIAPVALPAANVTHNSFTACWEEMEGAEAYFVNLYKEIEAGEVYKENDFSNNLVMPSGWTTSCTRTNGIAGYYGKSAPALRFDKDGQNLSTPSSVTFYRSIGFWYRASSVDDGCSLVIEGKKGNDWIGIDEINPLTTDDGGITYQNSELPDSITMLRLVYNGKRGALMVDDVIAGVAAYDWGVIEEFENIEAGNALSCQISGLDKGTEYQYSVRAFNGEVYSQWSDRVSVTTSTAINEVCVQDESPVLFYAGSRELTVKNISQNAVKCTVFDLSGVMIEHFVLNPEDLHISNLDSGIYLVKYDNKVSKVIVK